MVLPAMPSQARRTRPVVISVVTISRVVALMGTARPRPIPATAVLTPTIRPCWSARTPPLLPGLSAASVWMTSSTTRPAAVGSERPSADTMPAVTLPARPSGLPSATTSWPTRRVEASPCSTGGGVVAAREQDREVRQGVPADHVGGGRRPVGEGGLGGGRPGDDVGAGQQVAVAGDDARAARAGPTSRRADLEAGHRRQHRLGDGHDGARVGVERLTVVGHTPSTRSGAVGLPTVGDVRPRRDRRQSRRPVSSQASSDPSGSSVSTQTSVSSSGALDPADGPSSGMSSPRSSASVVGQVVGLDQHVAGLGALGRADHPAGLEQVHQAAGLGEPDPQLALQHRGRAELRRDDELGGLQQQVEVVADVVVDLLLRRDDGDVVAVARLELLGDVLDDLRGSRTR